MAGGPILPSSIYLGGAAGNLSPTFYIPTTNTNGGGAIEGIGVVLSLATDQPAVLQFNMPEVLPTGVLKLRTLAMANATTGVAKFTVKDGSTSAASNIGVTTLSTEAQQTITWSGGSADILQENKLTLTDVPLPNDIVTVLVTYNGAGSVWTLAQNSVFQHSLVWE
jgi:hypothetical protein